MPDKYNEIESIAKYNLDNGTNFYTIDQVNEHIKKLQRLKQLQQEAKTSPTDIGEDVHAAYVSAKRPKSVSDVYDVEKFEDSAKTTNAVGLAIAGALPEMVTYGVLPGLASYLTGTAAGVGGGYLGEKAGNYLDKKFNTSIFTPSLEIVGGLAGYGVGNGLLTKTTPFQITKLKRELPQIFGNSSGIVEASKTPVKWRYRSPFNKNGAEYGDNTIYSRLYAKPHTVAHEYGHHVSYNYPGLKKDQILGAYTPSYEYSADIDPQVNYAENFADWFKTATGRSYKWNDPNLVARQKAINNGETKFFSLVKPDSKLGESKLSIAERAGVPKSLRGKVDPTNYLQSQGFSLPRKHLQGDDAVKMFKEYGVGEIPENSQLIDHLRKYVPEVRERYGLVGNRTISDEEIAGSLYKKALELGGDTAAVNEVGEPIVLFRGSTKRNLRLYPKGNAEQNMSGADNILGNLFLGELPGEVPGEGLERYLGVVRDSKFGTDVVPPDTKAAAFMPKWAPGVKEYVPQHKVTYNPKEDGLQFLYSYEHPLNGTTNVYKIPAEDMEFGANDINAYVTRTPNIRDATDEVAVLTNFSIPVEKQLGTDLPSHYRALVKDMEQKNQGLLVSYPKFKTVTETRFGGYKMDPVTGKITNSNKTETVTLPVYRDEHSHNIYYALPNFNILNTKHLLPFDFRITPQWNSRIVYRKQGGTISAQLGTKLLNKWQQLYDSKFGSIIRTAVRGTDSDLSDEEYFQKHGYYKPVGELGAPTMLLAPEWEGLEFPEITAMHYGLKGASKGTSAVETSRLTTVPQKAATKTITNWEKFLQKPIEEQNSIVRMWNGERYSNFPQLHGSKDIYKFKNWLNKQ